MTCLNGILLAAALVFPHETPNHHTPNNQTPNNDTLSNARTAATAAERSFGPEHPATAMILRNLALAYQQAGFYNRAESTALRSLAALEAAFGPGDVSLTPVLNVLTETYVAEGRLIDARRMALRAVAVGPDAEAHYATALHNLGAVFEAMARPNQAAEFYKSALAVRESLLPPGHPYTQLTRAALARLDRAPAANSAAVHTDSHARPY